MNLFRTPIEMDTTQVTQEVARAILRTGITPSELRKLDVNELHSGFSEMFERLKCEQADLKKQEQENCKRIDYSCDNKPDFHIVCYFRDSYGRNSIWENRWSFWVPVNLCVCRTKNERITKCYNGENELENWHTKIAFPYFLREPNVYYLDTLVFNTHSHRMSVKDGNFSEFQKLRIHPWFYSPSYQECDCAAVLEWAKAKTSNQKNIITYEHTHNRYEDRKPKWLTMWEENLLAWKRFEEEKKLEEVRRNERIESQIRQEKAAKKKRRNQWMRNVIKSDALDLQMLNTAAKLKETLCR